MLPRADAAVGVVPQVVWLTLCHCRSPLASVPWYLRLAGKLLLLDVDRGGVRRCHLVRPFGGLSSCISGVHGSVKTFVTFCRQHCFTVAVLQS